MNLYDITQIERDIERIAEANDGEIPEELLQELVIAQTQSLVQIEKLCRYIKHLDIFGEMCDSEIDRISKLKSQSSKRMASIKRYLTPYVKERGKFDAGTFKLSTRKSTCIDVDDNFDIKEFMREKITYSPDREKIKEALQAGALLPSARIVESDHLQIK